MTLTMSCEGHGGRSLATWLVTGTRRTLCPRMCCIVRPKSAEQTAWSAVDTVLIMGSFLRQLLVDEFNVPLE